MTTATTLLILGASGDLTRRLLLPGLGTLLCEEPDRRVRGVGADRNELSQEDWDHRVRDALTEVQRPVREGARRHLGEHARACLTVLQQAGRGGGPGPGSGGLHVVESVRDAQGGEAYREG